MTDIPKIPLPEIKGYCIYDPATGLYSRGGYRATMAKTPKIWSNIGHLKNHLTLFIEYDYNWNTKLSEPKIREVYTDCVIINVVTKEIYPQFPREIIEEYFHRKYEKE